MTIQSNRGQATIESVFTLMTVFCFVTAVLAILYFYTLRAHLQYSSHELLVCREFQNTSQCDSKFQRELRSILKFGRVVSFRPQRSSNSQSLKLLLRFEVLGFQGFTWTYEDQINLPLQKAFAGKLDLPRLPF
jgi:hypothetical protein